MAESLRACAACGTSNEEDARFCEGCGASLARTCATCGIEASATARFCRGCGAPLSDQAPSAPDVPVAAPVRKTVTVMFADLAGSTTFEERVDAETAREVMGRYHDLLRLTAERHRAGVTKYIGDGFMAVWGVPEIGPDDAVHAVEAAVELQERFVGFAAQIVGVELALRVSVNTGEVVVGANDADLVGDALNVGARLESECPRGHVVVGEETWRATRGRYGYESLGQVQVKGRIAPVSVYQWVARKAESTDAAPFVGRRDEVRRLQAVLDDAKAVRTARLVTVIGDPGVGKSRLAAEFTRTQADARIIDARCVLEGTVALAPLVEVLRARDLETDVAAGISERDRLLRALNGLASGVAGSVEENFWALRRFVEVLATSQPVVLVLDDIQWADTLLLDFIEHLVEWVKDVPVLVLALARPELRDIRPELVAVSRWASEAIHLAGLDAGATAELAAKVLGAARLPDDLLNRLPASTGGNPLFVRELIGMLAHDGVLVEEPHGWRLTIDVDAITIPPTIHALLASRLERLDAADRRVLEIASVVGSDFSVGTVVALADRGVDGIKMSLNRLRRLELAQPSGAYVGDEPVWRFHHVLIRDVAYRRLLKSDRANLHERLADWVAAGGQSVAFDADEMIARHLEAAHTYRVELGTVDEHTGDLALRAARHYTTSARRALDRDELVSAGTQAARGAAVAAADEALHAELLLIGCEAYLSAGDVAAGAPLVDDLDRIADESLAPWATCYRCQFVVYTEPERLPEVDSRLQGAIDEFARRKDSAGLAKAHRVRASARSRLGRIGDCETDLFEALIAARQSGDHRQITAALGAAPGAALWGPSPVPKAGGRCLDVVRMQRMTTAAPSLEATSLRHLAVLELLRGRPDKARKMLADARQVVADLGLRHGLMETELFAGIIESMDGDPVAAEPHFRTALDGFNALGVGADAGQAAALLARTVLAQGRVDEADHYAGESERLAGRNLKTAIAWRAVRAEILAAQGRFEDAVALARNAVAVAAGTDLVLDHADACLALHRVLAAAGDTKGANGARANAESLYIAKEVTARIGRTVEPAAPAPAAVGPQSSRLAVANRASAIVETAWQAYRAHDIDTALADFSDRIHYDDHRPFSGLPIGNIAGLREATERSRQQYAHLEWSTLAVRGERLELRSIRMWDDDGNEATTLNVLEIDDQDHIEYWGRFDGDDFESAYRELDRRYYAGEGAGFAEGGSLSTESFVALTRGDYDRLFSELCAPEVRIENRSRSAFPDRSAADMRTSWVALDTMTSSSRTWASAVRWLSPRWVISRVFREAIGHDGERYSWDLLLVSDLQGGRIASMYPFDLEDEDAAFAYVEERVRATTSRMAVTNRASELAHAALVALQTHDVDALRVDPSDHFVYDDRRRITGDPIRGADELHAATERILESYPHTDWRTIAVRGERLEMHWSRLWDDDGNEARTLNVMGFDDAWRLEYFGRFEEDDFETAYRELETRYYAGEGAAFAEAGIALMEVVTALNQGDFDRLFTELCAPDVRFEAQSRSAFPTRTAEDLRASFAVLDSMVVSSRTWLATLSWLSPEWVVTRFERTAVGQDGEQYSWTRITVTRVRDGRLQALCEFEIDDEAAAFAYAEERTQATANRLAVTNLASATTDAIFRALNAHDIDGLVHYAEHFVYDDRRSLKGDPIEGIAAMRRAKERIFEQYTSFEFSTLAVRGQRLVLIRSRWSDVSGNETGYLHVCEIDDQRRVVYDGRFDEDDFEGAYGELERRYYAGEGAEFADVGTTPTEVVVALNRGDFDKAFGEFAVPSAPVENRSRMPFPNRSADFLRASFTDLDAMVASTRIWFSALCWVSKAWTIIRFEREAVGKDGEQYGWTHLVALEIRNGRIASMCEFEVDDEDAAFAYAEERMRTSSSRLEVTNRSCVSVQRLATAMQAHDLDAVFKAGREDYLYIDRRRLGGEPIQSRGEWESALRRLFDQYSRFDFRPLAVRGERLSLHQSNWSDDAGNVSAYLHLFEIDAEGHVQCETRFDEDDFENAFHELERRYYAAEGAAFAASGEIATEVEMAMIRHDYDRLFGELVSPNLRIQNRSRSVFPDRSLTEFRASIEELDSMVASSRTWNSSAHWVSPNWSVVRQQREAIGLEGERFAWSRIYVAEIRDGRMASMCEFDIEDEDAAFAYAEERAAQKTSSRLSLSNRASATSLAIINAMNARDVSGIVGHFSDRQVYDDRRRLGGAPVVDARSAIERVFDQYTAFEIRILAVRGERLCLSSMRWRNDEGFETNYLVVFEVDESGKSVYDGRFDEDDFNAAYRELERRYCLGEGAAFAEVAMLGTEYLIALNEGAFDRAFNELTAPRMRVENRTRTGFPDRSLAEFRRSFEELNKMAGPSRSWNRAECWLSPTCGVVRTERAAVGQGSEDYAWEFLVVLEAADGRCTHICEFDLDDEAAAFAYAEERVRRRSDES